MFERATKEKFRFPYNGQCSTEDLWDLNADNLKNVLKELLSEKKATEDDGFLDEDLMADGLLTKASQDTVLDVKIAIVRHIRREKLLQVKKREQFVARKAKIDRLEALMAEKQDESLKTKSLDELRDLLAELRK